MSSIWIWVLQWTFLLQFATPFTAPRNGVRSPVVKSLRMVQSGHTMRDVGALQEWATKQGITLGDGISVLDNGYGDCGIHTNKALRPGDFLFHIPPSLLISSKKTTLTGSDIRACQTGLGPDMEQYLPEFLVMIALIQEISRGSDSLWLPWLQSLPSYFRTGLWMNDKERMILYQLAPKFMQHQQYQWEAFMRASQALRLDCDPQTLLWAFTIVFTRSWRAPPGNEAVIAPIGDMVNHHSSRKNVDVSVDKNGCGMVLTRPIENCELFLDYGITQFPERFLVIYGFLDPNPSDVALDIDYGNDSHASALGFNDFTQMTINFESMELSKKSWNGILYKVLLDQGRQEVHWLRGFLTKNPDDQSPLSDLHTQWGDETRGFLAAYAREKVALYESCLFEAQHDMIDNLIPSYCHLHRDHWMRLLEMLH